MGVVEAFQNDALISFDFPVLSDTFQLELLANAALATVSFPQLSSMDGDLKISGNAALASLSLPLLEYIGGDAFLGVRVRDPPSGEPSDLAVV